jgi:hypothetical protein
MNPASPKPERTDIVVPEEAVSRGPLMSGELRSVDHSYPGMLVQFKKIAPHARKSRIYLFPTVEQAKGRSRLKVSSAHAKASWRHGLQKTSG